MPRYIDARELRRLVPMADAIAEVGRIFVSLSRGEMEQPQRIGFADGALLGMIARRGPTEGTVAKLVSVRESNASLGIPDVQGMVLWFDDRGRPSLVIEGAALTALRTGAASGAATALLAAPYARSLAILGTGGQAWDQVEAVLAVRPIEEVLIGSRNPTTAGTLAERLRHDHPKLRVSLAADARAAVRSADVICCATTARAPLFHPDDLGQRVHINAIGAFTPSMCEVPAEVLARARPVVVDQRDPALSEAGDLIQAIDQGYLTAGDLIEIGALAGEASQRDGWTVFKSVGIAAQDWAVARLAQIRSADSEGTGR